LACLLEQQGNGVDRIKDDGHAVHGPAQFSAAQVFHVKHVKVGPSQRALDERGHLR
jgi:hypothetical protein